MPKSKKKKKKKLELRGIPSGAKRLDIPTPDTDEETVLWCFDIFDENGWCEDREEHCVFCAVAERMKTYGRLTWHKIETEYRIFHRIPRSALVPEAKRRLAELKMEDIDELGRLKLNGRPRLWGIRRGRVFNVLWYDPEHVVCPSPKKHT